MRRKRLIASNSSSIFWFIRKQNTYNDNLTSHGDKSCILYVRCIDGFSPCTLSASSSHPVSLPPTPLSGPFIATAKKRNFAPVETPYEVPPTRRQRIGSTGLSVQGSYDSHKAPCACRTDGQSVLCTSRSKPIWVQCLHHAELTQSA